MTSKQTELIFDKNGKYIDLSIYAEPYFYDNGSPTDPDHPRILYDPRYQEGGPFGPGPEGWVQFG